MADTTTHYDIPQVDPEKNVSDEVFVLIQAFEVVDDVLFRLAQEIVKKLNSDDEIAISKITNLQQTLDDKMLKSRTFKLTELTDVIGAQEAMINYIMTKGADGYVFRSALSVLGAHLHDIADVRGLQPVLNTFIAGAASSVDGEVPVFQSTTGKQLKNSGVTIASLRDGGTY
ncbi:hypothetical protein [Pseudochrobactrum asaccharolyticum]|jgi:hypothetical protein|uniref:Uncharacterized protein n=1 Tax=Pseudochrobactrum asaccharolyticum TaxID=354351 RepID=A0A366DMR2_9HYPH|nr:hypothetical protein [Pseudochrobactrum asaccharolyticum]RBO90518.1 hypothetical protein DFR47_11379 [Pseudochrobactrum asaccharolyticum]